MNIEIRKTIKSDLENITHLVSDICKNSNIYTKLKYEDER